MNTVLKVFLLEEQMIRPRSGGRYRTRVLLDEGFFQNYAEAQVQADVLNQPLRDEHGSSGQEIPFDQYLLGVEEYPHYAVVEVFNHAYRGRCRP